MWWISCILLYIVKSVFYLTDGLEVLVSVLVLLVYIICSMK